MRRIRLYGIVVAAFMAGAFLASPELRAYASTIANDVICSGCVGTSDLAGNAVTSPKIKDGEVKTADIGGGAVNSAKIADNSITAADIGANAVGSSEITTGAVGGPEILDSTISSSDLASAAVMNVDLATAAVTSIKIADNSILAVDIAPDAVGASEIAGVTKLLFGQCNIASGPVVTPAGDLLLRSCAFSGVGSTDRVLVTHNTQDNCFVVVNAVPGSNEIDFALRNTCDIGSTHNSKYAVIVFHTAPFIPLP